MQNLRRLFTALVASAATLAAGCSRQERHDGSSDLKRDQFINTIHKLAADNQFILLGDTDHSALGIRELLADPDVISALAAAGIDILMMEDHVKQNIGYDPVTLPEVDPARVEASWQVLYDMMVASSHLKTDENGQFQHQDAENSLNHFLEALRTHEHFGVETLRGEFYAPEFAHALRTRASEMKEQFPDEATALLEVLDAMDYLKAAGQMPVYSTTTTMWQSLQAGTLKPDDLRRQALELENPDSVYDRGNPDHAKRDTLAFYNIVIHTASHGMELKFPDIRDTEFKDRPHLKDFWREAGNRMSGDSALDIIHGHAWLNAERQWIAAAEEFGQFIEDSLSPKIEVPIVQNIIDLAGDRKAIVLFGYAHMDKINDFDEMLQRAGKSVVVVALYENPEKMAYNIPYWDSKNGVMKQPHVDIPQYMYNVSTDEMIPITPGSDGEARYKAREVEFLTRAEYERAKAQLPANLQSYAFPYSEYDADWNNNVVKLEDLAPKAP